MSKKAKIYASIRDAKVMAAQGEMTGKPTFNTLARKVTDAAKGDARFDKRKPGDESSWNNPYCVDILVPDDDGTLHAVIQTSDQCTVRHPFTWDGSDIVLGDGDPEKALAHTVYASDLTPAPDATVTATAAAGAKEGDDAAVITAQAAGVFHAHERGCKITAEKVWKEGQPVDFQWMPEGVHTIVAGWGDRAIQLTVNCTKESAETVQASLDAWKAEHPNRTPFGCIEHKEQDAAVRVKNFLWNDTPGKSGIYCSAVPTKLGASNVSGKVFDAWSPTFTTDAETDKCKCSDCGQTVVKCNAKGDCNGVAVFPKGARGHSDTPASVTGVGASVGSLTNKPAFEDILSVTASKKGEVIKEAVIVKRKTSAEILAELEASMPKPKTSAEILASLARAGKPA